MPAASKRIKSSEDSVRALHTTATLEEVMSSKTGLSIHLSSQEPFRNLSSNGRKTSGKTVKLPETAGAEEQQVQLFGSGLLAERRRRCAAQSLGENPPRKAKARPSPVLIFAVCAWDDTTAPRVPGLLCTIPSILVLWNFAHP